MLSFEANTYSASTIAIAAALFGAGLTSPAAAADPKVIEISVQKLTTPFDQPPAVHMRQQGATWVLDKIEAGTLRLKVRAKANVGKKIVMSNVLVAGKLADVQAVGYVARTIERTVTVVASQQLLSSSIQQAASWCSAHATVGKASQSLLMVPVRFEARADKTAGSVPLAANAATKSAHTSWQGSIVCGPRARPAGPGGLATSEPTFKAKGIHLRFLTTAGYSTRPNPALQCKVTTARVRVATTKAGPVRVRLWTKVGNGPAQSQFLEAWSKHVGPGKYEAVVERTVKVSKSSSVQAKAEELVNPIGLGTGWKSVMVHCTGAGGGGLATAPSSTDPDSGAKPAAPKPPKRAVEGGPGRITAAPSPTHGRIEGGRMVNRPLTAKERFDRKKPHVN